MAGAEAAALAGWPDGRWGSTVETQPARTVMKKRAIQRIGILENDFRCHHLAGFRFPDSPVRGKIGAVAKTRQPYRVKRCFQLSTNSTRPSSRWLTREKHPFRRT